MKRILATVLSFALLLTMAAIPISAIAGDDTIPADEIMWDGVSAVNSNGQYMRTKLLSDGTVAGVWYVMGSGAYFAISYDGGMTFPNANLIAENTYPADRGETDDGYGRLEVQNPNIIEMTDGTLMMTYRYNTFTSDPENKPWTTYYTSICYRLSHDGGKTWSSAVAVKENTQTGSTEIGQHGYWEPDPVYIGDTLFLYFADTVTYTNLGYQNILGCVWNGSSFGETFIAQDGSVHSSRDGMSVVTKLADGTYAMVFESTNTGNRPADTFVIKISKSPDGINWSEPVTIASPQVVVPQENADKDGARAVCAAPYIITLPDGRIAVSYRTTDLYSGTIIPNSVVSRSVTQVMISNLAVGGDTTFSEGLFTKIQGGPVEASENQYARGASLNYIDGKLLCYYHTGVNREKDGVISSVNNGIKVSYCDVKANIIDGSDLANYMVYNSGSKNVTAENGSFTMPTGCTNMIYADTQTETAEMVKTADLDAAASFTLPTFTSGSIQTGFDLRVQQAEAAAPGLTGYALKLIEDASYDAGVIKLQLTRYGTNSSGTENQNLGDMKTYTDTTVLGGNAAGGQTLIMSVSIRDNTLSVELQNAEDLSLKSVYDFDLTQSSTKSSVVYNDYYSVGGFGFYENGNYSAVIGNISFKTSAQNLNKIDTSNYTVYAPENSKISTMSNAFISNDASTKKIILNDAVVNDFSANATFKIGTDGNLKAGIIFRAQNIGNNTDDMEGYSCVLYKTPNTTNNSSRIVMLIYKWARQSDGSLAYLGTVGSKVDLTTLASVYPQTETNLLASAEIHLRLNLSVTSTVANASFDVFDENNQLAATSPTASFNLAATPTGVSANKEFTEDAYNTVFNAGSIGISISSKGEICDFNLEGSSGVQVWDYDSVKYYSNNTNTFIKPETSDYFYSSTTGYKQAVLSGCNLANFAAVCDFKSTNAGSTYNMGIDFCIDEATHSGYAYNTTNATMGFEGYRLVLVRNANTNANPAGTMLYLYQFKLTDSGYERTQLASAAGSDFFSDYTSYGAIKVNVKIEVSDGLLTATAVMKEHPDKVISLSYNGIAGSGAVGYYVSGGGYVVNPSVTYDIQDSLVTSEICENGFVYAALNSGAADIGDTVKIIAVAEEGYEISKVYSTVGDVKTEIPKTEGGYLVTKQYGKTLLSAEFAKTAIAGDLNDDGIVNATDIAIMRRVLLGIDSIELSVGDLNGDNQITVKDLVRVKKYAARIITE